MRVITIMVMGGPGRVALLPAYPVPTPKYNPASPSS